MVSLNSIPRKLWYLLLFGFLVRLVWAWLPEKYLFYLVSDDAYYYFTIARNLATRGIFSADGITLTNGFHPLWLFLITPIFFFFSAHHWFCVHLVLTFSAVFDAAAGFLIYLTLEKFGKPNLGFWGMAFYLVNPYNLVYALAGLETPLNSFLLALLVYLSVSARPEWLKTKWFLLGTVAGLALLSRTDSIFVVAVLFGYLWFRYRTLPPLGRAVLTGILVVAPWLVYNQLSFGTFLQTSGTAYPWLYHQEYLNEHGSYFSFDLIPFLIKQGFYFFAENANHYGNWILSVLVGGFLLFCFKGRSQKIQPLQWVLWAALLFMSVHVLVRWSVRPWYPQTVFVLTLPIVAILLEKVKRWFIWPGVLLILFSSVWQVWSTPFMVASRSLVMLDILAQLPPFERVGVFNSGFVQYFTDRRVINLDGLVNNEVLSYYERKEGLKYFHEREIRWLVDNQGYLGGLFGPYFGEAADTLLIVVDVVPNIAYLGNNLAIVEVRQRATRPLSSGEFYFGEGLRPWRERAVRHQWGPVPWPKLPWR